MDRTGRLDPALAAVRSAVGRCVGDLPPRSLLLVACSGGADSLALLAGTAFVAPRAGLLARAVTVDHGLQAGSAQRAAQVAALADMLELPADVLAVHVGRSGGPEGAARAARYAVLDAALAGYDAAAVLLGHSLDDQAETVLLGLARGSGARSLAGMPERRGHYRRPLLGLRRATLRQASMAAGLEPWDDPHNTDPAFTRTRVRHELLPALEAALGPGVAEALARTARLTRADADALDELADAAFGILSGEDTEDCSLDADALSALAPAVRSRVLHAAVRQAGRSGAGSPVAPTHTHIDALDALVTRWHGQGPVALPGGLVGVRRSGRLRIARSEL